VAKRGGVVAAPRGRNATGGTWVAWVVAGARRCGKRKCPPWPAVVQVVPQCVVNVAGGGGRWQGGVVVARPVRVENGTPEAQVGPAGVRGKRAGTFAGSGSKQVGVLQPGRLR